MFVLFYKNRYDSEEVCEGDAEENQDFCGLRVAEGGHLKKGNDI